MFLNIFAVAYINNGCILVDIIFLNPLMLSYLQVIFTRKVPKVRVTNYFMLPSQNYGTELSESQMHKSLSFIELPKVIMKQTFHKHFTYHHVTRKNAENC